MPPRIIADGADGFLLLAPDNRVLGWARGRAIGITGFEDQPACIAAAVNAYRTLDPWLERHQLPRLHSIGDETPTLVHDGAHQWIRAGHVPVARLVVIGTHDGPDPVRHAFEIVLRGNVSEAATIHASLVALDAARAARAMADDEACLSKDRQAGVSPAVEGEDRA